MRIINTIKRIKIKDLVSPLVFVVLLIPSFIFRAINKIRGRKLWLVAEDGEARDNGYHFYKYVRMNHVEDYCFFAIRNESADRSRVENLGNLIKWGSLKHWLFYMAANLNISSQKSGNPCPIFWYVIHVTFGLYRNRVFLQHGITKDDSKWLYYEKTKFKYFVCGAKREYDYILKKFGYKKENLLLTGFPRWDNLKDTSSSAAYKSILVMPTWRNWLGGERNKLFEVKDFKSTAFFKNWNVFLNDKRFIEYVEKNNITIYFYPHINMMSYIGEFKATSKNIKIVDKETDMQVLFDMCDLMVTDYSSVAFDFAYLNKPVVYFQFDREEYRAKQYAEGYYNYARDGFGPVVETMPELVERLQEIIEKKDRTYEARIKSFYGNKEDFCSKQLYLALGGYSGNILIPAEHERKISIIIPVYNGEKYISRCLDQLVCQNYENYEVVIVDDGSTDNTSKIIKQYSEMYGHIKLLKQKNSGPSEARKKGIRNAEGDIIMFIDSDDFVVCGALGIINELFKKDVDVIRFGSRRFPTGERYSGVGCTKEKRISKQEITRLLLTSYSLNSQTLQAYKTSIVQKCDKLSHPIRFGEDFLTNLYIHENTNNMLLTDRVLYYYCENCNSATRVVEKQKILNNIIDRAYVSNQVIEYAKKNKISYRGEIIYRQIKMIRDVLLNVAKIPEYRKNEFNKDFKKIISGVSLSQEDFLLLKGYLRKMPLCEKIKNRIIVLAIANGKCAVVWNYICLSKLLVLKKTN